MNSEIESLRQQLEEANRIIDAASKLEIDEDYEIMKVREAASKFAGHCHFETKVVTLEEHKVVQKQLLELSLSEARLRKALEYCERWRYQDNVICIACNQPSPPYGCIHLPNCWLYEALSTPSSIAFQPWVKFVKDAITAINMSRSILTNPTFESQQQGGWYILQNTMRQIDKTLPQAPQLLSSINEKI